MKLTNWTVQFAINRPKSVLIFLTLMAVILGSLIVNVKIDTDPENMLSQDEAVRVFHNAMKKEFTLHDVVVLGIVNEKHPSGVFNPATLKRIEELTQHIIHFKDNEDPSKHVVSRYLISPGTVDTIEQAGLGQVSFNWLMSAAPADQKDADRIRQNALSNPLLKGTMVSENGKAICLYIPISTKDFAFQVRQHLLEKISTYNGDDKFYITGLPVANDTFGVEMFKQMAISAPLAMVAIFLLMLLFFRKIKLIIAPMIVAMFTVICTMGLLIGTGNTVHIMSSMIPIFLMPIAVVDSIHILSEFFDAYQKTKDRRKTIEEAMGHLFMPMLYTSLTSTAGFLSLILTPIPPVQVFGLFVGIGIMLAWIFTILFIPAYIMMIPEKSLATLGAPSASKKDPHNSSLSRLLRRLGNVTHDQAKFILAATVLTMTLAIFGISRIQINDNPVKWFKKSHDIRVADTVLNAHFGGTYEAYLVLEGIEKKESAADIATLLKNQMQPLLSQAPAPFQAQIIQLMDETISGINDPDEFIIQLAAKLEKARETAADDLYEHWADASDSLEAVKNRDQLFKRPDLLNYIASLQNHIQQKDLVGKSNSIADVVKKIHQELFGSDQAYYRIPDSVNGVAQCLISFQNSHKPDDLWHLVTPDFKKANLWIQLKSGDNRDMEHIVKEVNLFLASNRPPVALHADWAGLTYINVVWQEKMVWGMLKSFLSSFVIVYIMMALLFRSPVWGMLAMVPLTVTIAFIYGIIGFIGKDYDMPVAVLSSLTLGLAVDFAIHFLERARMTYKKIGSWPQAIREMFEEPARAISRNVIVIAVGFTPLLAAPLVPYQTVGIFLASIMAVSGVATMFILPALITIFSKRLF